MCSPNSLAGERLMGASQFRCLSVGPSVWSRAAIHSSVTTPAPLTAE